MFDAINEDAVSVIETEYTEQENPLWLSESTDYWRQHLDGVTDDQSVAWSQQVR